MEDSWQVLFDKVLILLETRSLSHVVDDGKDQTRTFSLSFHFFSDNLVPYLLEETI